MNILILLGLGLLMVLGSLRAKASYEEWFPGEWDQNMQVLKARLSLRRFKIAEEICPGCFCVVYNDAKRVSLKSIPELGGSEYFDTELVVHDYDCLIEVLLRWQERDDEDEVERDDL